MEITINDKRFVVERDSSLKSALDASGVVLRSIAIALNGKVVPLKDAENVVLSDGDNIVIIKAFYGG